MAAPCEIAINSTAKKPIKLIKWKVKKGSTIFRGSVLALYSENTEDSNQTEEDTKKLKAARNGTVIELVAREETVIKPNEMILKIRKQTSSSCSHPTIMKDMCADCGADLRIESSLSKKTASVAMVHSIPELIVSQEMALELGQQDERRLLRQRKLVLLVDLDQTLIHTTNDHVPPKLKDVHHFQLWPGQHQPWYHTRLRPFTQRFIQDVSRMYELHICTFGVRMYAHVIARLMDPKGEFFSQRILSRDECFDALSKTANLKALFPCGDKMVGIIDDREDVWNYAPNLLHVKPYRFFKGTADINAPPGSQDTLNNSLENTNKEMPDNDASSGKDNACIISDKHKTDDSVQNTDSSNKNDCDNECNLNKQKKYDDLSNEKGDNDTSEENSGKDGGKNNVLEICSEKKEEASSEKKKETCSEKEEVVEWEDEDDYLLHLQEILTRIHTAFYEIYDQTHLHTKKIDKSIENISGTPTDFMDKLNNHPKDKPIDTHIDKQIDLPDLKSIIPYVRKKVLKGVNIVFSGMFPLNMDAHKSRAYIVAKALGANVQTDFVLKEYSDNNSERTTHLVAAKPGTGKHKTATKAKGIKIVNGDWLWACNERWERVDESLYLLPNKDFHNDSPEDGDTPKPKSNKKRKSDKSKQSPKGSKQLKMDNSSLSSEDESFAGSYNPRMAFSDEDLEFMDKEVDEILEDNDDSSESEDEREKRMRRQVLCKKYESESDSDSLAGDLPRGWKIRRKSMSPQHKQDIEDAEQRTDGDNDYETENELERYEKNMEAFAPRESDSDSGESIGSVDDEIADAVEREFLNSLM